MNRGGVWLVYSEAISLLQVGKDADLPVYFGDAGSSAILHSIGAKHARCAVITLDTPGANYRTVWALHKHYPGVKIYVRAHDVSHGITLEKVREAIFAAHISLQKGLKKCHLTARNYEFHWYSSPGLDHFVRLGVQHTSYNHPLRTCHFCLKFVYMFDRLVPQLWCRRHWNQACN